MNVSVAPSSIALSQARPITVARVVRTCETWKPLSGSRPS